MPDDYFAAADRGWFDFETRSNTDIKAGTYRYATEADAIVLAYAIGDGPVYHAEVIDFDHGPLQWDDLPLDFRLFHDRVERGEAVWIAWNAGFDRAIWNYATTGFPEMQPHHVVDAMVQATASALPPDLSMAAKMSGSTHKIESGKQLIALFCSRDGLRDGLGKKAVMVKGTPQSHPAEWREFCSLYATGDITAMREVFKSTRMLPMREWREYWAMEAINERGVRVDLEMAKHASDLAAQDKVYSNAELYRLTDGYVSTVDQVARITAWLVERLPSEGRSILIKREEEIDEETGEVKRPAKDSLTRKQVERLIAFCSDRPTNSVACRSGTELSVVCSPRSRSPAATNGGERPARYARPHT